MNTLRLILGDQLNYEHSWFKTVDNDHLYCLMEIKTETDYAQHHIQKILGFFASMREFAKYLSDKGHKVLYIKLDDKSNKQDFGKNIKAILEKEKLKKLEILEPDEFRLDKYFKDLFQELKVPCDTFSTEHFLAPRTELLDVFGAREHYLLENFYRHMRRKHNILMNGSKPAQGKWNFDKENRNKIHHDIDIPKHKFFKNDVSDIYQLIKKEKIKSMGSIAKPEEFAYPINRKQSLALLKNFISKHLHSFGTYQDAMTERDPFVFHSRLSFAMNTKMLSPKEIIDAAVKAYEDKDNEISIAQLEGFVRQILGWREFMRCFYWTKMPAFAKANFFKNKAKLPQYYWDAKTSMNCMKHCLSSSLENAYAHHIQRLMITGSFALMAGVDPDEVDEWYLGVYIDAIEWVEITNTRGMSQWADGGGLATKPYISSANYINKMSDYCKNCEYSHKDKYGAKSCPFNSLYWNFINKHRKKLENNPRMSMIYRVWDKFDEAEQISTLSQAKQYLENIEAL